MRKAKKILIVVFLLLIDIALYFFLGLLMLNYEDFYLAEDGPWYSLESMTNQEMIVWIAYQGWFVLNGTAMVYFVYYWINKKRPYNTK